MDSRGASPAAGWLQRAGDCLQRRQDVVRRLQWLLVALYYCLLVVPAILPQPASRAEALSGLAGAAEILFWGIWWPGVILSMMLFGQFWCGVFCPDGALTEWASRRGRGGKIPGWVRWSGWPLLAFALVTLYEHLAEAYGAPRRILVSLGGASLLALFCGYFLGRGKRVWCRYLCPAGGIFSLLARCAVFHFKVDRKAWDTAPKPLPRAVDCPPLLDVRRLRSNEKCSMCGRCSGHRNAVALSARLPGSEIVAMTGQEIRGGDALGIFAVLIGLSYGVIYGHAGWAADWLRHAGFGAAPGLAVAAVLMTTTALAAWIGGLLFLAGRGRRDVACHLAYCLIPLAGFGLFLGALEHSFRLLAEAGLAFEAGRQLIRVALLLTGALWSLGLGWQVLERRHGPNPLLPSALYATAVCSLAYVHQPF